MLFKLENELFLKQRAFAVWFTGLSGSGKTTLAELTKKVLTDNGYLLRILDGDIIRQGINKDLGFSDNDRQENIRRVAEIAKLFIDSGIICICCFISPTNKIRQMARDIIGDKNFFEVYLNASIDACEKRDIKGLYKAARQGLIKNFTGIDAPYEVPETPNLIIKTDELSVQQSLEICINSLIQEIKRN